MLYDSNGFNPYIYVLFFKTCPCTTHIYSIGPTLKSIEYQFFEQFPKFLKLPRQFSSDMSDLWPGHIRLAGQVWVSGFSLYKGAPYPLRTLGALFLFHSISCGGQGLSRRFWIPSIESLRFLGDLTPLIFVIFKS
jgi:hypothetical protein